MIIWKSLSIPTEVSLTDVSITLLILLLHLCSIGNFILALMLLNLYHLIRIIYGFGKEETEFLLNKIQSHKCKTFALLSVLTILSSLSSQSCDCIQSFVIFALALSQIKRRSNSLDEKSNTNSKKGDLKEKSERRYTLEEDERILELIQEGYFLCRETNLKSSNMVSLIYQNKKGNQILEEAGFTFEQMLEFLVDQDKDCKTLKTSLYETFAPGSMPGKLSTLYLSLKPRKANRNKDSTVTDINAKDNISRGIPFKFYKASFWRLTKTDILMTLREHNEKKGAISLERLNTGITCTLSNDLRTITNGITGNMELLEDEFSIKPLQKVHHKVALCSSYLLENKLNDLFDYIQLQNRGFKLHYLWFSLDDLIKEVTQIFKLFAKQKQLDVSVERKGKLPHTILGDKVRAKQILLSILTKAIEFTEYGKIVFSIKDKMKEGIVFKVISYGASMQAKLEQQINILSPSAKRKRADSGSRPLETVQNLEALSLQISQIICQEMGTKIVTKCVPGQRSEMIFALLDGFPSTKKSEELKKTMLRRCSTSFHCADFEKKILPEKEEKEEGKIIRRDSSMYKKNHQRLNLSVKVTNINSNLAEKPPKKTLEEQKASEKSLIYEEIPNEDSNNIKIPTARCNTLLSIPSSPLEINHTARIQKGNQEQIIKPRNFLQTASPKMGKGRRPTEGCYLVHPRLLVHKARNMDDVEKCSVLIVDDEMLNRMVLKGMLKKAGLNSIEVECGTLAVSLIERYIKASKVHEIKLIFMDLQMPDMNGIEATKRIRQLCINSKLAPPPIIGVSAGSSEADREKFEQAGIGEFFQKPLSSSKIQYILSRYADE